MSLEHDLKRVFGASRRRGGVRRPGPRPYRRAAEAAARRNWWRAAAASSPSPRPRSYGTHKVNEQRRGERARDQVLEAMRIAGQKAHYVRAEVRALGSHD